PEPGSTTVNTVTTCEYTHKVAGPLCAALTALRQTSLPIAPRRAKTRGLGHFSRSPPAGRSAGEGAPQSLLLNPPVAVFRAVDQDHRNPITVLGLQLRVGVHVLGLPGGAELAADPAHVGHRLLARVAVPAGQHRDLAHSSLQKPQFSPSSKLLRVRNLWPPPAVKLAAHTS